MQINVIESGGPAAFDYLLYSNKHPSNINYFQEQISNFSNSLTDIGRGFMEYSKQIYDQINNSSVIEAARSALRRATGIEGLNRIMFLENAERLRKAPLVMQPYIMANPTIKNYYDLQLCDGYSDTFVNPCPNSSTEDNIYYQKVMDGIVTLHEDEVNGDSWKYTEYISNSLPWDTDITFSEQQDILQTWQSVDIAIADGEDPTNIYGGKLGVL